MGGGVVMNDVGEMSSAFCWSVVEIVWRYGVWRAVPGCDDDGVCGESGGPSSPALWALVVAERWPAEVVVVVVGERWVSRLVAVILAVWER